MFIIRHDEFCVPSFGLQSKKKINVQNEQVKEVKKYIFFPGQFPCTATDDMAACPPNLLGPLYSTTQSQDKISTQRQAVMAEVRYGFLSLPRQMPG